MSLKCEVKGLLKALDVPGAVVLLKSDVYDSFLIKYGNIDVNDNFRVGSISKMFIGIVLLQLYEEKLIDLDKPVSDYLIGLPETFKNLTVREVGNLRSGVADYYSDERFQKEFKSDPHRNWLPSELFGIGITAKQSFQPGTAPEYSNTNPVILALIIERITKNSIQDEIKKRIFEPLKLSSTQFMELCEPHINGFQYNENILTDVTDYNMSWTWAAGSLTSNLEDISRFVKYAIGKHKLLNRDATKQQRNFLPFSAGYFGIPREYGFHLLKTEKFIGHNGSLPGYNTFSLYEKSTNTTLIVVVNLTETKSGILPADFINDYMVARLNNKTNYKDALKLIKEISKKS